MEIRQEEHKKSDKVITISKITLWKGLSGLLLVLLVISIFTGGFGMGSKTGSAGGRQAPTGLIAQPREAQVAQPAQPRQAAPSAPEPTVDMESLIDDDAVKGDPDAPVTIVEFSDFECPFCARFYSDTLNQIDEQYIQTGKVKFIYRDFPLNFHANAQKAAEAAECAGEQEKYYEMHDMLFEKGVSGGVTSFKQYAADIGLDTKEFDDCLDSGKMANEVKRDMADGSAAGIRGTPGFFINGQSISGAQPFSNFKQVIDAELAK